MKKFKGVKSKVPTQFLLKKSAWDADRPAKVEPEAFVCNMPSEISEEQGCLNKQETRENGEREGGRDKGMEEGKRD